MPAERRRIHGGLILASGLFGLSLAVLIMGASRGQATDAGLPGSAATPFALKDAKGATIDVGRDRTKPVVLIVARNSPDFGKQAREIRQIHDTFAADADVRVVGVQVSPEVGLLDAAAQDAGPLRIACPQLTTLSDPDGSVARAYRVTDAATAFIIDDKGILKGRFSLDHDGAAVAVAETLTSLRPAKIGFTGMQLPN